MKRFPVVPSRWAVRPFLTHRVIPVSNPHIHAVRRVHPIIGSAWHHEGICGQCMQNAPSRTRHAAVPVFDGVSHRPFRPDAHMCPHMRSCPPAESRKKKGSGLGECPIPVHFRSVLHRHAWDDSSRDAPHVRALRSLPVQDVVQVGVSGFLRRRFRDRVAMRPVGVAPSSRLHVRATVVG